MGISDSIPVDLYARIHKMEISPVWTKSCVTAVIFLLCAYGRWCIYSTI